MYICMEPFRQRWGKDGRGRAASGNHRMAAAAGPKPSQDQTRHGLTCKLYIGSPKSLPLEWHKHGLGWSLAGLGWSLAGSSLHMWSLAGLGSSL